MNFIKKILKNEKVKNIFMVVLALITIAAVSFAAISFWGMNSDELLNFDEWTPENNYGIIETDEENEAMIGIQNNFEKPLKRDENTLVIWDYTDNNVLKGAINDYKKKNKNINIIIENEGMPSFDYLENKIEQGEGPDIVYIDQVYSVSMGEHGLLKDLNKYGANKINDKFVKSTVPSISFNKKQYALPFASNTIVMLYNKTALSEANVKVPVTHEEFMKACNGLKKEFGQIYDAYTVPFYTQENKNWLVFNYFFYLWRMGGDILSDDLKSAVFNSKDGIEALQLIVDMKNKGIINSDYKEQSFFDGYVGFLDNGTWQMNKITGKDKKADVDIGIAMLPVLKKGIKPYSGLGLNCYAVAESSRNPKLAYDFIEFYCTDPKYQIDLCKLNNFIPTLKEAQEDGFYKTPEWGTIIKQLENSKYRPSVPNWEKIESIITNAIIAALNGNMSPTDALNAAAKSVDKQLK